jgi:hypothetical protein
MANIEIEPGNYMNNNAIEKMIEYFIRPTKEGKILIGGIGVNAADADSAIEDFYRVKQFYSKMDGRQLRHYHVDFDKKTEKFTPEQALELAYDIAEYYGKQYQTFFSVHTDTRNLHVHFCSNSVSYTDGRIYREGLDDWIGFQQYAQSLIDKKAQII